MRKLSLEGNIAAGKTSLLRHISHKLTRNTTKPLKVIHEPVDAWQNLRRNKNTNLLHMFYNQPKRWAFTFQTYAFLSRAKTAAHIIDSQQKNLQTNTTFLLERSLHSDKQCFAKNAHQTGLFNDAEWAVYNDFYSWIMAQNPDITCDAYIYLRVKPATCLDRSKRRARKEEATLSLEYLQQLHALHEEWLAPGVEQHDGADFCHTSREGKPVLVLNCEDDFVENALRREEIGNMVERFITDVSRLDEQPIEQDRQRAAI